MTNNDIIECPKCRQRLKIPAGAAAVACPGCKATLKVRPNAAQPIANRPPSPEPTPAPTPAPQPKPSPAATTIKCPGCSKPISLPSASPGQQFKCPICQKLLAIPGGQKATPTPRPQSPAPQPQPFAPDPFAAAPMPTQQSGPAMDFGSLPSTPAPAAASGGLPGGGFSPSANPYATTAKKPAKPESSMNPAWKRFWILSLCVFVVSAIPIVGMFLGILIIAACILTSIGAYLAVIGKMMDDDAGRAFLGMLFPPVLGRAISEDWPRYRKGTIIYLTALGLMFVAFAGVAIQVFVLGAILGK